MTAWSELAQSLAAAGLIEDIWYFEAPAGSDIHDRDNLLFFVEDGADFSRIEAAAKEKLGSRRVGVHVFPARAMFQTPRPLLVKMAFQSGHSLHSGGGN